MDKNPATVHVKAPSPSTAGEGGTCSDLRLSSINLTDENVQLERALFCRPFKQISEYNLFNIGAGWYPQLLRIECGDGRVLDLQYRKYLSAGSYGKVLTYDVHSQKTSTGYSVVIKFHDDQDEMDAVELLRNLPEMCHQVLSQVHDRGAGFFLTIMPKYDGALDQILSYTKEDVALRSRILTTVANQVLCLHRNGFYYLDIKPPNILYNQAENSNKCHGVECFNVVLGDLGGVGISTYPIHDALSAQENAILLLCFLNLAMEQGEIDLLVSFHRDYQAEKASEKNYAIMKMSASLYDSTLGAVQSLPASDTKNMLLEFLDSKRELLLNYGFWSQFLGRQ